MKKDRAGGGMLAEFDRTVSEVSDVPPSGGVMISR